MQQWVVERERVTYGSMNEALEQRFALGWELVCMVPHESLVENPSSGNSQLKSHVAYYLAVFRRQEPKQ
jgi:hypothetical protein